MIFRRYANKKCLTSVSTNITNQTLQTKCDYKSTKLSYTYNCAFGYQCHGINLNLWKDEFDYVTK